MDGLVDPSSIHHDGRRVVHSIYQGIMEPGTYYSAFMVPSRGAACRSEGGCSTCVRGAYSNRSWGCWINQTAGMGWCMGMRQAALGGVMMAAPLLMMMRTGRPGAGVLPIQQPHRNAVCRPHNQPFGTWGMAERRRPRPRQHQQRGPPPRRVCLFWTFGAKRGMTRASNTLLLSAPSADP